MIRVPMATGDHFDAVLKALTGRGLLLAAYGKSGRANAMTIGWGTLGSIWSMPLWIVLVRPSRYTYECIEHSMCFSVNVPGADLQKACLTLGSKSGRAADKLAACGLTVVPGEATMAPTIEQCPIVYECKVVHWNDVVPANLAPDIHKGAYPSGDFHRLYFGMVLSARAAEDADALLG